MSTPVRIEIEQAHAFTDPDPVYWDAFDLLPCRDGKDCTILRVNHHPVHHVYRTVTYGPWESADGTPHPSHPRDT